MFILRVVPPLILQWMLWPITRPLFLFFGNLSIQGREHLDTAPSGAIFASNHTSELDAIIIPTALPFFSRFRPFFYTSREQKFYSRTGWRQWFYGGTLFTLLGAYPILQGARDYARSLQTHITLSKKRQSVIIFPEGHVGHNHILQEGRGGVSFIAYAAQVPIIPIAISGTYDLTAKEFFTRKRIFRISFGKPLYPQDLFPNQQPKIKNDHNDFKAASQIIIKHIQELDSKLQKNVYSLNIYQPLKNNVSVQTS